MLADCGSTLEGVAATGVGGMVACGSVDCGSTLESGACTLKRLIVGSHVIGVILLEMVVGCHLEMAWERLLWV